MNTLITEYIREHTCGVLFMYFVRFRFPHENMFFSDFFQFRYIFLSNHMTPGKPHAFESQTVDGGHVRAQSLSDSLADRYFFHNLPTPVIE